MHTVGRARDAVAHDAVAGRDVPCADLCPSISCVLEGVAATRLCTCAGGLLDLRPHFETRSFFTEAIQGNLHLPETV